MRRLAYLIIMASLLGLGACGKKPKNLEAIPNTDYPRIYPAPDNQD
jgi:major membrane immunogen (membrane-anchored lipoprotein)